MAITLTQFAKEMEQIAENLEVGVIELRRETIIGIVNRIAELTPVDTGQARSNWQVGVGAPPTGTRPPYSPIPSRWRRPYGRGGSRSERRNLLGVTMTAQGKLRDIRGDEPIYITNNLPYIDRLNQGWSSQSPAGFVMLGVRAGTELGFRNARFRL